MNEPVRVGKHGDAIRLRVEELHRTVNDAEITLPEMEREELAYAARVMVDWLGSLLGSDNLFLSELFGSLPAKKRVLVARETLREICAHAEDRIVEHPNYERRAERMKYGHNLDE